MKIWCQTFGALGKDRVWNDYEESINIHTKKVARPDTVLELHGCSVVPGLDRYAASLNVCRTEVIRNAIEAERQGYDAFVMINSSGVGSEEIREVINLPVVFALENCIHFAMMFAPRFAFLTHSHLVLMHSQEHAKQYGLADRMVPGDHLNLSYTVWPDMFGNPGRYIDFVREKAKGIISRGAGVLIPIANVLNMWLVRQNLLEIDGARILDTFGCAIKMAELMVELNKIGIARTKCGPSSKEELIALWKSYGIS
jgi:allantoin racemase